MTNSTDKFIELVENVCQRRSMYVLDGTFVEICAYLGGYCHASADCPLSGVGWAAFREFVCATFGFPSNYGWEYVLKEISQNDDEASARLQSLLIDFAKRRRTQTCEEIVREVNSRSTGLIETDPVKAWRAFSRAIHRGSKAEIEQLIQEHPDADVLWSGAYPDDVAKLLDEIQESSRVVQISVSDNGYDVVIVTPDFGTVGVKLIEGNWRIDASKVIDCWKANRDR